MLILSQISLLTGITSTLNWCKYHKIFLEFLNGTLLVCREIQERCVLSLVVHTPYLFSHACLLLMSQVHSCNLQKMIVAYASKLGVPHHSKLKIYCDRVQPICWRRQSSLHTNVQQCVKILRTASQKLETMYFVLRSMQMVVLQKILVVEFFMFSPAL